MWTQLLVFFFRSDNEHFNLDDLKRQEKYFSIHLGERQCIYPPASSKEKLFHAGPGIPIIKWYNAWKYFQKLAHQIYSFTESTQYPISITNLSIRFDNTVKLLFLITQEEVLKHMKSLLFFFVIRFQWSFTAIEHHLSAVYTLHNYLPDHEAHCRIDLVKDNKAMTLLRKILLTRFIFKMSKNNFQGYCISLTVKSNWKSHSRYNKRGNQRKI